MDSVTLNASPRADFGKGAARKLRRAGRLPVVMYRAGAEARHFSVDPAELEAIFRVSGNRNTLLNLTADGASATCLVKAVQRHPLKQTIQHLDLYEVDAKETVVVKVPVAAAGTAEGVKMGGRLRTLARDVYVRCRPADIPAAVQFDVTSLQIGRFIKASDATVADGVELVYKADFNVFTVVGKRGG